MQAAEEKRKNILIVEDEGLIADDIRRRLERLGYTVPAIASSGEEALRLARSESFDLVLMDIRLHGAMDGIAAAEQIRRELAAPVVYLTAHADQDTVSRAARTEPFGYILKPIAEGNLRSTVQIALYKHEMERRLRINEAWLSTTLRSIGDGIIATDTDGGIVFLNAVAERLTGWTAAEAAGRAVMEILSLRDDPSGEPAPNPIYDLFPDETRAYQLMPRNGAALPVEVECFENRDDRELLGAILVLRDIRERRQREGLQIQAQRMDAIASLAGAVGGPLSALSPQDPPVPEVIHVNQAVRDSLDALSLSLGQHIVLETKLDSHCGFIRADRNRFQQALLSLARHARGAMPDGGTLTVETSVLDLDPVHPLARRYHNCWFARLCFTDSGPECGPAALSSIFEPRSEDTSGLAVAHTSIVQAGGYISASSGTGRGTSFEILWPCAGTHREETGFIPPVLLVEEEDSIRRAMSRCLAEEGYDVLEAKTPADAELIAGACRQPISLLVADSAAAPLAARWKIPSALYLSGYRHDRVPDAGVLPKPFPIADFRRRIRLLVGK
jgi:two-component system cell cycle sensor histidine kinase/response regulator CckA